MRCPRCSYEIELAWEAIRRARRELKQCIECGGEAGRFWRCVSCRAHQATLRKARRTNDVQLTPFDDTPRSA